MATLQEEIRRVVREELRSADAAPVPDTGYPTFIKVNPDGSTDYEFEGHIVAEGLDLLAGEVLTPPDDRKVRWLREGNGALVAEITAHTAKLDSHTLHMTAKGEPFLQDGRMLLEARADGTTPYAYLSLDADKSADHGQALIRVAGAGLGSFHTAQIIDTNGHSSFLQLLTSGTRRRIEFGIDTVPSDPDSFSTLTVSHSLGTTPIAAFTNLRTGNIGIITQAQIMSSSSIRLSTYDHRGLPMNACSVQWCVIG